MSPLSRHIFLVVDKVTTRVSDTACVVVAVEGNYVDNWQCIAELKGDSPDIQQRQTVSTLAPAAAADKTSNRFISSAASALPAPSWH